ncbi:MAG: nucleoside deaminase [Chloroflexi bacterium]|nr:nucleoside deaminase [Chloroflexota bacterium]
MALALEEAHKALAEGNRPFGAVIVSGGKVVASGHNLTESESDPTAHGEITAIRSACKQLATLKLEDCTLYTTCEPCLLCSGAIFATRIQRVVIAALWADAPDYFDLDKLSFLDVVDKAAYPITFTTGVLRDKCAALYRT